MNHFDDIYLIGTPDSARGAPGAGKGDSTRAGNSSCVQLRTSQVKIVTPDVSVYQKTHAIMWASCYLWDRWLTSQDSTITHLSQKNSGICVHLCAEGAFESVTIPNDQTTKVGVKPTIRKHSAILPRTLPYWRRRPSRDYDRVLSARHPAAPLWQRQSVPLWRNVCVRWT